MTYINNFHALGKKYMVHVIKRRFRPRSCPWDNPRTALARDQKDDLRAGETRRAPSWVLYFLSAFERAGMILTGTNSSHAPSSSHLAKVYPTSTSMHLAWVADPFFSDFQKRSPLSFALSSKHKSYAKLF